MSIDEHAHDTEFVLQPTEENQLFILDINDIDNEMDYDPDEEVMVDTMRISSLKEDVWLSGPRVKTKS